MKVILAGHTVDRDQLQALQRGELPAGTELTPETVSAAYARISRSPDPIPELRAQARQDVDASRRSNRAIVFRMGHHSIAEHAALNFDILGISRLALEALEDARLCSYTEKSQRYVTFGGEHLVPEEFGPADRERFETAVKLQVEFYRRAFDVLHAAQRKHHPELLDSKAGAETVEGWAKEDARYGLGLATETQVGYTANARNLEYVVRKLRHHPLAEVRALSQALFAAASEVVPSLIILSDPERFRETFGREVSDGWLKNGRETLGLLAQVALSRQSIPPPVNPPPDSTDGDVALLDFTPDPDAAVIAALLHSTTCRPYDECSAAARSMNGDRRTRFVLEALRELSEFDSPPREFENAGFTFEAVVSAACFGQLKRHRMLTLTAQPYDPALDVTVPEALAEAGLEDDLRRTAARSAEAFAALRERHPRAAEYALTNAHRRRVLVTLDLREAYHLARLRLDRHAQWDIRRLSASILTLVRRAAPAASILACGKDAYPDRRRELGLPELPGGSAGA